MQARQCPVSPRVMVSKQPVATQSSTYAIAGCGLTGIAPPCITAQWVTAATRVRTGGVPVLLQDSQAVCTATGTGLKILVVQTRVKGV
jgi:uncharacterized Zn-binding protein involved in type VI secretion